MNELIFEGNLKFKEYFKLYFKRIKKPLIIFYISLILYIVFGILVGQSLMPKYRFNKSSIILRYFLLTIAIVCFIIFISSLYYVCTSGGIDPTGNIKVFKTSEDTIRIECIFKRNMCAKILKINHKEIRYNHLYLEESIRDYVFLPKEINLFL